MDRDAKFTTAFRSMFAGAGIEPVRLPPRSPNLNAWIERFMRSIKSECLDRRIFLGEDSLRRAVREYVAHYHAERNHQGLGNAIIAPVPRPARTVGRVRCRERLGGMLRYYHREAA
jgi:transposase InsO family protein